MRVNSIRAEIAVWLIASQKSRVGVGTNHCHNDDFVSKCGLPIYIIIANCSGTGAFPRPFCVPNSVALASLTLQVGDWAIR